jgi:Domain of unknown function (DUF6894)
VRAVVLESAREVLSQEVLKGTAASLDIQIEVEDERGQRLLVVPVGRVVDTVSQV